MSEQPEGVTEAPISEPVETQAPANEGVADGNPAWQPVLEKLPESLHPLVRPELEAWDKGVQEKLEGLRNEYSQQLDVFKDYQRFIDDGVDFNTAATALDVYRQINDDPQAVYDAIGKFFNLTPAQAAEVAETLDDVSGDGLDDLADPRISQLTKEVEELKAALSERATAEEQKRQDEQLNQELSQLKEKHGEFDEQFVLTQMVGMGIPAEKAVQNYLNMVEKIRGESAPSEPAAPAPKVTSANGGSIPISPSKRTSEMSGRETRELVVEMLKSAKEG